MEHILFPIDHHESLETPPKKSSLNPEKNPAKTDQIPRKSPSTIRNALVKGARFLAKLYEPWSILTKNG